MPDDTDTPTRAHTTTKSSEATHPRTPVSQRSRDNHTATLAGAGALRVIHWRRCALSSAARNRADNTPAPQRPNPYRAPLPLLLVVVAAAARVQRSSAHPTPALRRVPAWPRPPGLTDSGRPEDCGSPQRSPPAGRSATPAITSRHAAHPNPPHHGKHHTNHRSGLHYQGISRTNANISEQLRAAQKMKLVPNQDITYPENCVQQFSYVGERHPRTFNRPRFSGSRVNFRPELSVLVQALRRAPIIELVFDLLSWSTSRPTVSHPSPPNPDTTTRHDTL